MKIIQDNRCNECKDRNVNGFICESAKNHQCSMKKHILCKHNVFIQKDNRILDIHFSCKDTKHLENNYIPFLEFKQQKCILLLKSHL
jgi:hypothetical protein